MPRRPDHLVYAVPDLARAVVAVTRQLGVRPDPGGAHPGLGTTNALVSLDNECYLEIIGLDPDQPPPPHPRPFGIDRLDGPRLVTWAVKDDHLEAAVDAARGQGYDPGRILSMSRARPDGVRLSWRLAIRDGVLHGGSLPGGGLVPFLIDWGGTPHPAASAATGCRLVALGAEHPEPERVRGMLRALDVALDVTHGAAPALIATIDTPGGRVELR